ncbi:cell filamentation protein Fic [Candidatus Roizmanbacteria bacterium CG11_big_fil_rev_8_21_14_0_20_36_8]|uniref:Cell filamentation protein Fic n=2 Tax=Candidatus Roizmaniibacteriota TaxID=1752723 RepID=A0A2M6IUH8_9BACT|nr:MAG: cell filamentation protein Fic [Candidatus Roizmanbacteria bacterium CG11_big_fil_rev_8_21_14_0_20_36_8]PIZ66136.1 MAG: cell filamentation protein Fic [Candidatus Roizmanbacteria bacterium CG_4_10_14_0_2_um_filter_36_9]
MRKTDNVVAKNIFKKLPDNRIVFYQSLDGLIHIEVMFAEENIWLTQKKIAELFDTTPQNITQHLKRIFADREIDPSATCKDFLQVQNEGGRKIERTTKMYSLEVIIAVGYRVNSERGIEFRRWATDILKNYIQKGYALDSDRMKYGSRFSTRYFDDLYEEIKDIRTSERRIYQKITDIYATSFDYSANAKETKEFFATVQNKLHFAITGQTAAEIVAGRVDSKKDKMGLTTWRKSPTGKIMSSDVVIAKNYLNQKELAHLNRIGNMYLDYAEMQVARGKIMRMQDWRTRLDAFLDFSEYEILHNAGKVSHKVAEKLALEEYKKYKPVQDREYLSDFDKEIKKYLEKREGKNES